MSESNPILLAFDCSGASCSAAVLMNGGVVAEQFESMSRGQAEALLPMIQAVMQQADIDFTALDAIVTTTGPGSFTGLRIGIAAAQGLALASGRPAIGINAFESIFQALPAERRDIPVAVVIDSRRSPVFTQLFTPRGIPDGDPISVEMSEFLDWLPKEQVSLAGDGVPLLEFLQGNPLIKMPVKPDYIRAGSLARAAVRYAFDRQYQHTALKPLYLRAPDVTFPKVGTAGRD